MSTSNNGIYNTVGASISGVTNTLTITNPSNTASSAARETIVVGGGTAGDPTINWNVSGVTNFEMGLDNSDSDKLKISQGTALGTNDTWTMDTTGRRLLPLQPAFLAYVTASQNNVTGDNTHYTVIYDSTTINVGTNYNTSNGVFTAPITGTYLFQYTVTFGNITAGQAYGGVGLLKNTDFYLGLQFNPIANRFPFGGGDLQVIFTGSNILRLTANDTVKVDAFVQGGAKTVHIAGTTAFGAGQFVSNFSGFLLG